MATRTINLDAEIKSLQALKIAQMDGLYEAICGKLKELGSGPGRRAHKTVETGPNEYPGASVGGVLNYVKSCNCEEDVPTLQTLEAVIRSRHSAAGYTPKTSATGEPHEPFHQPLTAPDGTKIPLQ